MEVTSNAARGELVESTTKVNDKETMQETNKQNFMPSNMKRNGRNNNTNCDEIGDDANGTLCFDDDNNRKCNTTNKEKSRSTNGQHHDDGDAVNMIYNYKSTKGRVFMTSHDNADVHALPVLLPKGAAYFANYLPLEELYSLAVPEKDNTDEIVSLNSNDVHLLYEAKCIDQHLVPSWEREVHFMELINQNCQGNYFIMPESGFGENVAAALAHILSTNSIYSVVNLNGNRVRDGGAEALARMLSVNENIVHLGLSSNDIGGRGGEAIAVALERNHTLVSIDLGVQTGINGNHLTIRGAEALGHMLCHNQVLSKLSLAGNGLGVNGVEYLVSGLQHNTTLTHLDLSSNSLGTEGARSVALVLSELDPEGSLLNDNTKMEKNNNNNNDNEVRKENKGKTNVWEEQEEITKEGYRKQEEKREKKLQEKQKHLHEEHQMYLETPSALTLSALTHLWLQRNNIDDDGGKVLFDAIRERAENNSETLVFINLEHNHLSTLTAQALHKVLLISRTLQSIRLSGNHFDTSASYLFEGVANNKSCKELWLNNCHINDVAVMTACGNALITNHTLKTLSLAENAIKDKSVIELIRGLKMNKTLISINLSNNRIGDEGGHALAQLVELNTSLKRLYLRRNTLTSVTGAELSAAVQLNGTLEMLDVSFNDFTFQCVMDIKACLLRNAERNKRLLIPKLNTEIERLIPKEKELSQVEDFIETEKRMIKDRSEQLLRRNEEARVIAERLRREVLELEKNLEEIRSNAEEAEEQYRNCEDQASNEIATLKMKKTSVEARIQQEKDRVTRMQRDIDRMRRQIQQLVESENKTQSNVISELEELEQECVRSRQDCQDEMNKTDQLERRIAECESKRKESTSNTKRKSKTGKPVSK